MWSIFIRPQWIFVFVLLSNANIALFGQDKSARKEAFRLFELNHMVEAEALLATYCRDHNKDPEALFRWAQALFETNKLDQAITQFRLLKSTQKRYAARATFMLAKAHHHKHLFADAIKFYKEFLRQSEPRTEQYAVAINDIKRCAQGMRHALPADDVFLENMGVNVNSKYDDFAPIGSPNVESRIYFTSNRATHIEDEFSEDGHLVASRQRHHCDMFATEIENGAWSSAFSLNDDLNTDQEEVLQDFSKDGMIAYFTKGVSHHQNRFYVDSFANETQDPKGVPWPHLSLQPDEKVRGIYFFSDSTLFYASNHPNGFGGYDLYMSVWGPGGWTEGINLGREINSSFDEIAPFLAVDGRTLYFSSNRLTSIGGHDIFSSRFNERNLKWEPPQNLSLPINSAADDVHFRITSSGQSAHFSSNRKSGKGGQDIYAAYFKQPIQAQLVRSVPPIFFMVKDFQLFSESLVSDDGAEPGAGPSSTLLESEWDLESILYREDDQILTNQNKSKLDELVSFLKTYPHLELEILGHSDQAAVSNFDLFFSIKRTERLADYLKAKGIDLARVHLKGFGGSYPYAVNRIAGQDNKAGRFFNRRIDFNLLNIDKLPIAITQKLPVVASAQVDQRLEQFYEKRKSLYYRVEFANLDQLFKGDLIGRFPDPSIEKTAQESNYHYSSGIFSSFALALQHLAEIKSEGFEDAQIIPYYAGMRIEGDKISDEMIDQFPDLKEFILYLK